MVILIYSRFVAMLLTKVVVCLKTFISSILDPMISSNMLLIGFCSFPVLLFCFYIIFFILSYLGSDLFFEDCLRSTSNEGFCEAVKKFPLLEELDISNCLFLNEVSFDIIGQHCPLLKSLNFRYGFFDKQQRNNAWIAGNSGLLSSS